jgi:hypothetical protein
MNACPAVFDKNHAPTAARVARRLSRALGSLITRIPVFGAAVQTGVLGTNTRLVSSQQFVIVAGSPRRGINKVGRPGTLQLPHSIAH